MKTQLEVGDVLYNRSIWHGLCRYVIDRVTDKMAFAGKNKYKRDINNGEVRLVGEYGSATLENEKLKEEYQLQQLRSKMDSLHSKFNLSAEYSKEQLYEIIDFFNKYQRSSTSI